MTFTIELDVPTKTITFPGSHTRNQLTKVFDSLQNAFKTLLATRTVASDGTSPISSTVLANISARVQNAEAVILDAQKCLQMMERMVLPMAEYLFDIELRILEMEEDLRSSDSAKERLILDSRNALRPMEKLVRDATWKHQEERAKIPALVAVVRQELEQLQGLFCICEQGLKPGSTTTVEKCLCGANEKLVETAETTGLLLRDEYQWLSAPQDMLMVRLMYD